jgi:hypothetical protein
MPELTKKTPPDEETIKRIKEMIEKKGLNVKISPFRRPPNSPLK